MTVTIELPDSTIKGQPVSSLADAQRFADKHGVREFFVSNNGYSQTYWRSNGAWHCSASRYDG